MFVRGVQRWMMTCLVVPLLACCLASTGLAMASQVVAARIDRATAGLTPMCVWARSGQVGLWWNTSISPARAFANAPRYNAVCVALPWAASFPQRGLPRLDISR
ncbi:MAG: hypothetical protein ACT4QE_08075 [Anaerolineales bacterium]